MNIKILKIYTVKVYKKQITLIYVANYYVYHASIKTKIPRSTAIQSVACSTAVTIDAGPMPTSSQTNRA